MRSPPPDDARIRQAIAWSVRLRFAAGDPQLLSACSAWRAADPGHEQAWQRIQALHGELDGSFRALPSSVATFDTLEQTAQRLGRRKALKLLSLGLTGVGAAWLARDLTPWPRWTADYATRTGERRTLDLSDGTRLLLNTDSAVDVRFDARQRLLRLRRGEIHLSSGADPAGDHRPLRVQTEHRLFEALGTRFLVRQDRDATRLSVEQGAVAILPTGADPVRHIAEAGQHYRVDPSRVSPLDRLPMEAGAWTEGLIVTRDMRLADFLAEVARYRDGHLGCADAVADLRLSGVYRLDDTDALLALLPRSLPVRVRAHTRWWVTVEARV
nr:FecR family protein [Pseudomonas sp. RIT-PI-AD]